MKIRTFWTLLLKILGLWILIGFVYIIPQLYSTLAYANMEGGIEILSLTVGILLFIILLYYFIVRIFLFKTSWLIDKLKLESGFTEEKLEININEKSILTIAVIVIGGLIFVEGLPVFCKQVFDFLKQQSAFKDYNDASWLVFDFIKTIIGYLLMTNSKTIVNYINNQRKEA